ncbi:ribose 5-phosphate isomerase B [Kineosphaera limosa]|uniref:Ribose-5-phosphate isomerase B n=1 Tax=Kineosphaera limosa NBRC 100340 TaxID=1184609 RepID=K6XDF6_9MICO|nr:ribose-5-phosphate isomerase [Kineosphaera limosa]NYE02751.1 ribose 5-phosphate isomerase B [Kineosphaera limosa]GAB96829.1 ribose-5-phosphate isomerase B [Kineosphaera limosa NBRC 100340]
MRVHLGADHAAYELKNALIAHVESLGHEPVDHGPFEYDADDDYPRFVVPAAQAVAAEPESLGIVLGGSGNGEQIAANKVAGVRAVLAYSPQTAQLGRQHNNAQVVAIGARMTSESDAKAIVETFLATPFSGDPRHERRLALLAAFERTGQLPQ